MSKYIYDLENCNCLDGLRNLESNSVDMILTSPPYDNLRSYQGYDFDFECIASELSRVLKDGGVIIWVTGDQVIKGSESLSSFKQAIYFVENCGLKLHDTMIYRKLNYMPQSKKRYEQEFEFMFCFVKGKIETFNGIRIPSKYAGVEYWGVNSEYEKGTDKIKKRKKGRINETKLHGNIFEYRVGSIERKKRGMEMIHSAIFPMDLALDMISTFSNEGDLILDPFSGSATSCLACMELGRRFKGYEISEKYYKDSLLEIENYIMKLDNRKEDK